MQTYCLSMIPGPVSVPEEIRKVYQTDYGSGDLEPEFFELCSETATHLKRIIGTENSVVIQSGEAMLTLWGALKSCLLPADRVLAIGTGVFGRGIGEMAGSMGAEVKAVNWDNNETIMNLDRVETVDVIEKVNYAGYDALKSFRFALKKKFFPYTPDWYGIAALNAGTARILNEGITECFNRHQRVAVFCRNKLTRMGLTLFHPSMRFPHLQ